MGSAGMPALDIMGAMDMVVDIIVESTVSVDMLVLVTMEAMDIMVDMEVVTMGATVAHQALMMTTEQD